MTTVATPMASQFRRRTASAGVSVIFGAYPFTEPAVRPRTKNRWSAKNTQAASIIVTNAAAGSKFRAPSPRPARSASSTVSTRWSGLDTQEDQGHQVVVPDPEELEDRERCQHRHRQRHDEPVKIAKWLAPSIFADSMIDDGSDPM